MSEEKSKEEIRGSERMCDAMMKMQVLGLALIQSPQCNNLPCVQRIRKRLTAFMSLTQPENISSWKIPDLTKRMDYFYDTILADIKEAEGEIDKVITARAADSVKNKKGEKNE
ncbi:hypothetical protein ES705_21336 [subsurface metagenome]